MNIVETEEVHHQHEIARSVAALGFIQANKEILEKLNLKFSVYGDMVDFDNLQRPDVVRVLKAFGGHWVKAPSLSGGIHYTNKVKHDGFEVRCYNGEPPPSCKIVEKITYKRIRAHKERIVTRTVVCK